MVLILGLGLAGLIGFAAGRWWVLGLGLLVGLAVAAVILSEQVNAAYHSVDELRSLTAAPVLLSIPLIVTRQDTERHKRWLRVATISVATSLVLLVGVSFYVAHGNETLVQLVSRGRM